MFWQYSEPQNKAESIKIKPFSSSIEIYTTMCKNLTQKSDMELICCRRNQKYSWFAKINNQ